MPIHDSRYFPPRDGLLPPLLPPLPTVPPPIPKSEAPAKDDKPVEPRPSETLFDDQESKTIVEFPEERKPPETKPLLSPPPPEVSDGE